MLEIFTSNTAAYTALLKRLCPPGEIWRRNFDPDRRFSKLLAGLAQPLHIAHNTGAGLISEMDPRYTSLLLVAWERVAGLPDPLAPIPATLPARRLALHAKLTAVGSQTPVYYIAVAANLGVAITITEPGLTNVAWAHHWLVYAPSEVIILEVGEEVGLPLATYTNKAVQLWALFQKIKPSHTIVWLLE